jgi:hypothetical protein
MAELTDIRDEQLLKMMRGGDEPHKYVNSNPVADGAVFAAKKRFGCGACHTSGSVFFFSVTGPLCRATIQCCSVRVYRHGRAASRSY